MTSAHIVRVALCAFVILVWVTSNDRDIAQVTAKPDHVPWWHIANLAVFAGFTVYDLSNQNWISVIGDVTIVAMCARVVWHWWRRRRQEKPSRVLGLVRDLGHKLTVVPVRDPG